MEQESIIEELQKLENELIKKSKSLSENLEKHYISMADGVLRAIQRIEYVSFHNR